MPLATSKPRIIPRSKSAKCKAQLILIELCMVILVCTYVKLDWPKLLWPAREPLPTSPDCTQPIPPTTPSKYSAIYDTEDFAKRSAERLSGAVQIPTISYDTMKSTEDERWAPFLDFHKYLEQTFPILHTRAVKTIVQRYSLLYTLQGSDTTLKPLLLTGHLDVVPATALDRWTYPPFEGKIAGGWIHGRGAADCKNNVIGILSAVEHLLASGWKPRRTLLLGFGQDEEIGGHLGAFYISRLLESSHGPQGIAMMVDEGGMGIKSVYGTSFALAGVAEKGALNAVITVDMAGGHSSVPPPHTTIGILSKIMFTIEDTRLFKPVMKSESPMWRFLTCISEHGKGGQVPAWITQEVSSKNPNFELVAENFAATSPHNRYLIQTSKALTIFNAGVKSNALAESARANVNARIEVFSSHEEVKQAFLGIIKAIAQQYSLLVDGEAYSEQEPIGNISVAWSRNPRKPSPVSPSSISDPSWEVLSRAMQASLGWDIITAPSLLTGNTDTRHYWNVTRNIYRWTPAREGTRLNVHTVDEKIWIDTHIDGIRFYTELILIGDQHSAL